MMLPGSACLITATCVGVSSSGLAAKCIIEGCSSRAHAMIRRVSSVRNSAENFAGGEWPWQSSLPWRAAVRAENGHRRPARPHGRCQWQKQPRPLQGGRFRRSVSASEIPIAFMKQAAKTSLRSSPSHPGCASSGRRQFDTRRVKGSDTKVEDALLLVARNLVSAIASTVAPTHCAGKVHVRHEEGPWASFALR